jgi:hypothetical protein
MNKNNCLICLYLDPKTLINETVEIMGIVEKQIKPIEKKS